MTKKTSTQKPTPGAARLVDEEYEIKIHPSGTGEAEKPQIQKLVPVAMNASGTSEETSPPMTLDIWLKVSGHRPEQVAGFRFHARQRKLGPETAPGWAKLLADFMGRQVR